MSAFAGEDYAKAPPSPEDSKKYPYRRLEFGHAALGCMTVSMSALAAYYGGLISASAELRVEIMTLAIKTYFEIHYKKWGPDSEPSRLPRAHSPRACHAPDARRSPQSSRTT